MSLSLFPIVVIVVLIVALSLLVVCRLSLLVACATLEVHMKEGGRESGEQSMRIATHQVHRSREI